MKETKTTGISTTFRDIPAIVISAEITVRQVDNIEG
jgi:hypothetical protein